MGEQATLMDVSLTSIFFLSRQNSNNPIRVGVAWFVGLGLYRQHAVPVSLAQNGGYLCKYLHLEMLSYCREGEWGGASCFIQGWDFMEMLDRGVMRKHVSSLSLCVNWGLSPSQGKIWNPRSVVSLRLFYTVILQKKPRV